MWEKLRREADQNGYVIKVIVYLRRQYNLNTQALRPPDVVKNCTSAPSTMTTTVRISG